MSRVVVAAIDFDSNTSAILGSAVSFARFLQADLHLVHVTVPLYIDPADRFGVPDWIFPPPELVRREDELRELARSRLVELSKGIPDTLKITTSVVTREVVDGLVHEASERGALALVIGCHPSDYRVLSEPFSQALRVMHLSKVPVLVVHEGAVPNFEKEGFHLLVGDDLSAGSLAALRTALVIASRLPKSRLIQLNIAPSKLRQWEAAWALMNGGAQSILEQKAELEATSERRRINALKDRANNAREEAEARGTDIVLEAKSGPINEELDRALRQWGPDLLVFGSHKMIHTRPFLIGHMPLRAMLHSGRPVLVVPAESSPNI